MELTCVLEDTRSLLEVVLNGDAEAAKLLSQEVHRDVQFSDVTTDALGSHGVNIDVASLGVWIDPIGTTTSWFCIHNEEPLLELTIPNTSIN